jgi:hypothetical protein
MSSPDRREQSEGGALLEEPEVAPDRAPGAVDLMAIAPSAAPVPEGLFAAPLASLDEEGRRATIRIGSRTVGASLDPAVDTAVARTALARGERVIAQREGDGFVVIGALRTAATPGVDAGDEFTVRARRVAIVADHEFSVTTGAAGLVMRARGYVETIAEDITSRASSLHKIVGRMIRLN